MSKVNEVFYLPVESSNINNGYQTDQKWNGILADGWPVLIPLYQKPEYHILSHFFRDAYMYLCIVTFLFVFLT